MLRVIAWVSILTMSSYLPTFADPKIPWVTVIEQELNNLRVSNGLSSVRSDQKLMAAAFWHAEDMSRNNFISHTGSNGLTVDQRVRMNGFCFRYVNENIAKGYRQLNDAFNAWYSSPGHRNNLLAPQASLFGFAEVNRAWVLVLAAAC